MSAEQRNISPLLAKLQAANETWLEGFEGRGYLFRVPTKFWVAREDARRAARKEPALGAADYLRAGLVNWRGVKESDVVPGGAATEAVFDADACMYWLEQQPDEVSQLCDGAIAAINTRWGALEALEKK